MRKLKISLTAEHFNRYRLCVTAPNGNTECHNYRLEEGERGSFSDSVRWRTNFSIHKPGAYTAVWKSLPDNTRVAKRLGFHV